MILRSPGGMGGQSLPHLSTWLFLLDGMMKQEVMSLTPSLPFRGHPFLSTGSARQALGGWGSHAGHPRSRQAAGRRWGSSQGTKHFPVEGVLRFSVCDTPQEQEERGLEDQPPPPH